MTRCMWIFLMAVAVYFMFLATRKNKIINGKNAVKLYGIVIDNRVARIGHNISAYYPIYEYEFEQESRQYVSECMQFRPIKIGTKGIFYYDKTSDKIVEATVPIIYMMLAVMFSIISIISMLAIG